MFLDLCTKCTSSLVVLASWVVLNHLLDILNLLKTIIILANHSCFNTVHHCCCRLLVDLCRAGTHSHPHNLGRCTNCGCSRRSHCTGRLGHANQRDRIHHLRTTVLSCHNEWLYHSWALAPILSRPYHSWALVPILSHCEFPTKAFLFLFLSGSSATFSFSRMAFLSLLFFVASFVTSFVSLLLLLLL